MDGYDQSGGAGTGGMGARQGTGLADGTDRGKVAYCPDLVRIAVVSWR